MAISAKVSRKIYEAGTNRIDAALIAGNMISPRCVRLIEAMRCYHYPDRPSNELPEKDGVYDHAVDALRYFFVNYAKEFKPVAKRY